MKLPRWLVIAMLTTSILSVLVAAGFWWVTWPKRTLNKYIDLLSVGRLDEANRMVHQSDSPFAMFDEPVRIDCPIRCEMRTYGDAILGRQYFTAGSWVYRVERGVISSNGPRWDHAEPNDLFERVGIPGE